MSSTIKNWGNFLFWIQIVCGFIAGSSPALKMLESTQGVTLSFFLSGLGFMVINLWLSFNAFTESHLRGKVKYQSILIYAMWTIFSIVHIGIVLWKMPNLWGYIDVITISILAIGTTILVNFAKIRRIQIRGPYIKMWFAILFKSIPQLLLAITIFLHGGSGVSGVWLLFAHIIIISRIGHLWTSSHQGWNKNTRASFISELWNEATWSIATISWLIV